MLDKLYGKYFQKSKTFLYPILGIRRMSGFNPDNTYITIQNRIKIEDMKLISTFRKDNSKKYQDFEEQMLLTNPLFDSKMTTKDLNIYIFNLEPYSNDFINFLLGKYSKLSIPFKKAIKSYYGENSPEYKYLDSYLHPDKYFETYSKLLGVNINLLIKTGELCDIYNPNKENLNIELEENFELSH
jgi:hypothetical protein